MSISTFTARRKLNIKVLIPAAGFGTRVGSPPAKELLLREDTKKPLIQYALDMASKFNFVSTVISRNNKTELNDYIYSLDAFDNDKIELCGINSSKDWQDSILKSQSYWGDFNIVILPDISWDPELTVGFIKEKAQEGADLVLATHLIDKSEINQWGVICENTNEPNNLFWCEKPNDIPPDLQMIGAWGIFGFHKKIGKSLLQSILESQDSKRFFQANQNGISTARLTLTHFKDWTRELI